MSYPYLKAAHVVFIVAWFSGLFYLPRLFVYVIEAQQRPQEERVVLSGQLLLMAKRLLFGITWPAALITAILGITMLIMQPAWLSYSFMHVKLFMVVLLYLYHISLHMIYNQLRVGLVKYTSQQMRIWNEVPTLLLISIVFLIILKSTLSMFWGILGLVVLAAAIMVGIRVYKIRRQK